MKQFIGVVKHAKYLWPDVLKKYLRHGLSQEAINFNIELDGKAFVISFSQEICFILWKAYGRYKNYFKENLNLGDFFDPKITDKQGKITTSKGEKGCREVSAIGWLLDLGLKYLASEMEKRKEMERVMKEGAVTQQKRKLRVDIKKVIVEQDVLKLQYIKVSYIKGKGFEALIECTYGSEDRKDPYPLSSYSEDPEKIVSQFREYVEFHKQ